ACHLGSRGGGVLPDKRRPQTGPRRFSFRKPTCTRCERAARNRHSAVEPLDNPGWRKYREAVRVSERGPRRTNLFDKREMKLDRNRSSGTGGSELRITHRV